MTLNEARQKIIDTIVESTETELGVTEEMYLVKDLGLSSMEVMVLLSDLEEGFGIRIPVSRLSRVQTVGDLSDVVIAILTE